LLHEYGHHLGLEHKRRGIMHPQRRSRSDFEQRAPSPLQKKRWTTELARLVLKERERKWRAQK
jgi:predicted Zn-dependent protease